MSFGISAGDFIAAAKLIGDIRALDEIEHLRVPESQQNSVNAIKVAALQCRYVLEDYAGKFKKYGDTLSCGSGSGGLRGVKRKLQFGLGTRKEVQELRVWILVHVEILDTRLLTLGLWARLGYAAEHLADTCRTSMSILSDDTKSLLANHERRIVESAQAMQTIQTSQGVILEEAKSMLVRLLDLVRNDVLMRLDQVIDLGTKVWISQRQISSSLLKWGAELPYPDISHAWFQRPCRLEDPLGRYHPIASEYSYTQMLAVVLDKFQSGPGSRRLLSGEYEISNSKNCAQLINKETFTGLIPGMSLRMAILLHELQAPAEGCPIPSCGSQSYSDCIGGGKICSVCGTWFALESGKSVRMEEVEDSEQENEASDDSQNGRAPRRRIVESQVHQEPTDEANFEVFKNVRLGRFGPIKASNEKPRTETQKVTSRGEDNSDSPSDEDPGLWQSVQIPSKMESPHLTS